MTTEKICFRYDGSPEAKEALKWINKTFNEDWSHIHGDHFTNEGRLIWKEHDINFKYQLVPPAEFLRIVKGESPWTPKYGEEVEVSDNGVAWTKRKFLCFTSQNKPVVEVDEGGAVHYNHLRPVRKSLREELHEFIKDAYNCFIPDNGIDRIIQLVKERRNEL